MKVPWKLSHLMFHRQGGKGGSTILIDNDDADNKCTRRSRTRFMIYINMSLINWYSKKQYTIETLVFGAELVAMKVGVETLHTIQYKLWMMGVPISGSTGM